MKYIITAILFFSMRFAHAEQSFETVSQKLDLLMKRVENEEITEADALLVIDEKDIDILIKPSVISHGETQPFATGRGVCTGSVQGVLCFDLKNIDQLKSTGQNIIWVTDHISNDDLCYIDDISGIFALKEDPSSHAVIVTRVHNIPCITLSTDVTSVDHKLIGAEGVLQEGDVVTLDAFNGKLFSFALSLYNPNDSQRLDKIMNWAEKHAQIVVHGNADTAEEAKHALSFGARGVDPRTEHMFFHPTSLKLFRKVILSEGKTEETLTELQELQKKDFIKLYQVMKRNPVKIRLLDPPLHEFLPTQKASLEELADEIGMSYQDISTKVDKLHEINPMMGHRGIRLLLTHPEILKMQARAIFEAVLDPSLSSFEIEPYIILPMVICDKEMIVAKKLIDEVRDEVSKANGKRITYHLGAMIETPRACLLAKTIAPYVDFVSFGTNDLTGQTLALSRGDIYEKFLKFYFDNDLLASDPFSNLDPAVCELIRITVEQMRQQDHPISIGLCGEQGSEKTGVFNCHMLGLNTVSCSPYRIPAVKLFAAQAAILHKR